MFACPFLPSTCVILQQDEKLSTPKVCATAVYFCVRIFVAQAIEITCVFRPLCDYPKSIHIFFTEMSHPCDSLGGTRIGS